MGAQKVCAQGCIRGMMKSAFVVLGNQRAMEEGFHCANFRAMAQSLTSFEMTGAHYGTLCTYWRWEEKKICEG
jgi:hypothetical protein